MKHHTHLSLNTVVTVISMLLVCFLIYTVTIKQDAKSDMRYKNTLELIEKQQNNLSIEQANRQFLERKIYNIEAMFPTPTMGEIIINKEALE